MFDLKKILKFGNYQKTCKIIIIKGIDYYYFFKSFFIAKWIKGHMNFTKHMSFSFPFLFDTTKKYNKRKKKKDE
jgi:hypothetical protein